MVVVGDIAGPVLEQVEAHDLLDPPAPALVAVGDVAELVDQLGVHPGLLGHLAPSRLLGRLVPVGWPLGSPTTRRPSAARLTGTITIISSPRTTTPPAENSSASLRRLIDVSLQPVRVVDGQLARDPG